MGHTDEISLRQFIYYTPLFSSLLGAPLLQGPAMNDCLEKRCSDWKELFPVLTCMVTSHDALVLLRASFSASVLQHTLRASPCNGHEAVTQFDNLLRIAFCKICNVSLYDNQCLQASLAVKSSGLGLRRVASLHGIVSIDRIRSCSALLKCLTKLLNLISRLGVTLTPNLFQSNHQQPNNDLRPDNPVVEREFAILLQHQV